MKFDAGRSRTNEGRSPSSVPHRVQSSVPYGVLHGVPPSTEFQFAYGPNGNLLTSIFVKISSLSKVKKYPVP